MMNLGSGTVLSGNSKISSARLPVLQAPGPDSNYLDWEFVVTSYFEEAGLEYIIKNPKPVTPLNTWINDHKIVCALITPIDPINLCYICEYRRHAHGMWSALTRAHQDQTAGG